MIQWSQSPKAEPLLCIISFAESSFFPIPPDVMLISMGLANPNKSWRYAFLTLLFSLLGGLFGYILGYYAMHWIEPFLMTTQYYAVYQNTSQWFTHYGIWVVFVAGFSPIPYKVFTLAAGAMAMPLIPFLVASFFGRGLRFYLVAALIYFYGSKIDRQIRQYIDYIGWLVVILLVIGYFIYKYY
jgi:membrane protein YqaA with SNARE-associated domain